VSRARHRRVFDEGKLKGGTLTWTILESHDQVQPVRRSGTDTGDWGRQTRCWVLRERERFLGPGRKARPGHPDAEPLDAIEQAANQGWYRPNVENCIVDASIFNDFCH
jgi:hypothetical protein